MILIDRGLDLRKRGTCGSGVRSTLCCAVFRVRARSEGSGKRSETEARKGDPKGEPESAEGSDAGSGERGAQRSEFPVTIAEGIHLFPYRTQKLSLHALKVLGRGRPGRIGRCRDPKQMPERSGICHIPQ